MVLYKVTNKKKLSYKIAANNAEMAKDIAMKCGHARKRENLTVTDITVEMLKSGRNLTSLVQALVGRPGIVVWTGLSPTVDAQGLSIILIIQTSHDGKRK